MISSIVIYGISYLFSFIGHVLTLFTNLAFPVQVQTYFIFFISKLNYLKFVFPVSDLMLALGWFTSFLALLYTYKIVIWVASFVPFLNIRKSPGLDHTSFSVMKGQKYTYKG